MQKGNIKSQSDMMIKSELIKEIWKLKLIIKSINKLTYCQAMKIPQQGLTILEDIIIEDFIEDLICRNIKDYWS